MRRKLQAWGNLRRSAVPAASSASLRQQMPDDTTTTATKLTSPAGMRSGGLPEPRHPRLW